MTTPSKRQPIPFGKYLLLDRINIGGMAEVWRGKMFGAGGFERIAAIKRILPSIAEDEELIEMFIDEAKISAQLTHANIAQIHELGQIGSSYFIAMEYIPGKDMRSIFDRCRKKLEPAPVPLAAYCVSKMCEGLDYAHRKKDGLGRDMNIVHRDVSPQNVLVSYEGEVKVIDFGIAKAANKATRTQAGILKGKFGYMSPEQVRGLPLDRRSDIFAIGVCLYELLTGERLFVGDTDFSVLEKVRKAEVLPPSTYNRRIPEALDQIVLKALARDVGERYPYASELGEDLQRFLFTSNTVFGRKDLMQYMKSTFAEEVEGEKQRLQEYAKIQPPEGMLAAIEMGFSLTPSGVHAAMPAGGAARSPSSQEATVTAPIIHAGAQHPAPSSGALPRLTATTPASSLEDDDENGATVRVNRQGYQEGHHAPTGQPGLQNVGQADGEETRILFNTAGDPAEARGSSTAPVQVTRSPAPVPQAMRMPPRAVPPVVAASPVTRPVPAVVPPAERTAPPVVAASPVTRSVPAVTPPADRPVLAPHEPAPETVAPPAAPAAAPSSRSMLFVGLGGVGLLLVVLAVLGHLLSRPVPTGFLVVELPADVRAEVRVNINGEDVETPGSGPVLKKVPVGPAMVMVSAEGYETYTRSLDVEAGSEPARVQVQLERLVRSTRLVVVTQPQDAEVRLDGKVVREQGNAESFIGEIPVGVEVRVEARAPGFRPYEQRVTAEEGKVVDLTPRLEPEDFPVQVKSMPAGATILAGGRAVGTTPALVRLPPDVKQVTLRLRCFDDAEVAVAPAAGESPSMVHQKLKKQPRCR